MACEPKPVSFKNRDLDIAGQLRLPNGFDDKKSYAALVIVTPGSSVKEQIGAVYGSKMADRGFVTLTFDPSYQGESGGEPRDLEDPAARVEDVRCAVDYLMTLPYVDEERLGVLGVCNGGGYAVNAAMTEHRFKAVGTVVAVNMGRAWRQAAPSADRWKQSAGSAPPRRVAARHVANPGSRTAWTKRRQRASPTRTPWTRSCSTPSADPRRLGPTDAYSPATAC